MDDESELDVESEYEAEIDSISSHWQNSKCLLCGGLAQTSRSKSHWSESVELIFSLWNENCTESFCKLFNIDESFQKIFIKADYCSRCHGILRDIDFTFRTLHHLQLSLNRSRKTVEVLLKDNYDKVQNTQNETNDDQTYDSMVNNLCEAVLPSLSLKNHRNFSKELVETGEILLESRESGKLKSKLEPVFQESNSELESLEGEYENSDSEFSPYTTTFPKVILKDEVTEVKYPEESEEYSNSDSSDEEWEMKKSKKKKKKKNVQKSKIPLPVKPVGTKRCYPKAMGPLANSNAKDKKRVVFVNPIPKYSSIDKKIKSKYAPLRSYKSLKCEYDDCIFSCSAQFNMTTHLNKVHKHDPTPFHCDLCERKFGSRSTYNSHYKRHTSEPKYPCEKCGKLFFEKWVLTKHRQAAHEGKVRQKALIRHCPICAYPFRLDDFSKLEEHKKLHSLKAAEEVALACVLCDEQNFPVSSDLKTHVLKKHNSLAVKCQKCDKVFKSVNLLRRHTELLYCERNPNLQCNECSYVCKNKSELVRHLANHRGDHPFLCSLCGNTFSNKRNLKLHMMMHTGDSPYKCKFCPKGFNQTCKLKAHEETHLPTKNYTCEKCGKSFRTSKNIYQHRGHCRGSGEENERTKRENHRGGRYDNLSEEETFEDVEMRQRHEEVTTNYLGHPHVTPWNPFWPNSTNYGT